MSRGDSGLVGMPEHGSIAAVLADYERRLQALESADRLTSASIGSGGLRLKDGGTLTVLDVSGNVIAEFDVDGMTVFEADGSTLMELDGTGIVLNDGSGTKLIDLTTAGLKAYESDGSTLVVLDGSKLRFNRADGSRQLEITPAGGLKIYDTDGTTEKVVLDATGLEVDGGVVQAVWFDSAESVVNDTSLSTTVKQVNSATINPPSWVEQVTVFGFARGSWDNSSGGIQSLEHAMVLDDGGSGEDRVSSIQQSPNNIRDTHQLIEEATFALSPSGRSISTIQEARVLSGSNSDNIFALKVFVIGVRSSFT